MLSISVRRVPVAAIVLAVAGSVILTGCGAGAGGGSRGPDRPSPAAPILAASTGWPTLLDGPSHDADTRSVGPTTSRVRWRRALGAPIVAGPVVTSSGTADVAAINGVLHAIDLSTGRDRWTVEGGGRYGSDLSTAALIPPSGEILWPGSRDRLFALRPTGKLLWSVAGGGQLLTPVLDPRRRLLVIADVAGHVSGYRLRSPARRPARVWSLRLAPTSFGNPALAADGTIYETAGDRLFAIGPSGRVRWSVRTPDENEVSPAIAADGIVVFGSDNREEYGVDPDGHVRWTEKIGNYTYLSPLALSGRRVGFGNHSGQMTVLDSDTGHVIRRDSGSGEIWTSAAVDARGDVYFATRTGQVYGFGAHGHRLLDFDAGGKFDSYPALAPDGALLIGGDDGTPYAIGR